MSLGHSSQLLMAIYPGSFDPFHQGHYAVVRQALQVFDYVFLVVSINFSKTPYYSLHQRIKIIQQKIKHHPRIKIISQPTLLTTELAQALKIRFIIRGLRNADDLHYEWKMHHTNQQLLPGLITIYFTTNPQYQRLSSKFIVDLSKNAR